MRSEKCVMEIYRALGGGDHIATVEFESLSLLRAAIIETHDKKFRRRARLAGILTYRSAQLMKQLTLARSELHRLSNTDELNRLAQ
jgi:hypothetical protein